MIIFIEDAGATGTYRIPITIPDASIASTLTDFPVYIDLSTMPSGFWAHLAKSDGGDIRVKNGDGSSVPFDLFQVAVSDQTGHLFFKKTLTDGGDTTVYIHYGDNSLSLLPATDTYGRNAVWSDYHRVHLFGGGFVDRTGSSTSNDIAPTSVAASPFQFTNPTTSADLGGHQGVAWDGTHYYITDNNLIKKYDASWSLVATNSDPCGDVQTATGDAVDHCGDPCVVGGVIYVPVEIYVNISTWSLMKIAMFNASDLSFIGADAISAQAHEASSVCYRPADDNLYVSSYADGSKLWKYARSDRSYQGTLSLSSTIPKIQGVTFWRTAFWINSDETGWDCTVRVASDGRVQGRVWGTTGGNYEGIDFNDAGLLLLHDTTGSANGVVRELRPLNIAVGGGADLPGISTGYLNSPSSRFTTWTIGVSVNLDAVGANRAVASYGASSSAANPHRATLSYRHTGTNFGLWNDTDTWLMDAAATPSTGTTYRLHVTHNGTTDRKIYRNGGNQQVDTTVVERPSVSGNRVLLGTEDGDNTELLDGKIGFYYLRASELSAAWIAAEYANINAPGSFYGVGSEQPA